MEQPVTIKYRWTADEMYRAERYHFRFVTPLFFRGFMHLSFGVLLLAGVYELNNIKGRDEYRTLAITFVIAGVYWFALRGLHRRVIVRRRFAKRPDRDDENEWHVTPERIVTRERLGNSEFGWESIVQVVRTPGGVILYPPTAGLIYPFDQLYFWLPRRGFASEAEFERFMELAKSKIHRYGEVAGPAADWAHPLVTGLLAFPVCWFLALLFHVALFLYRGIKFGFADVAFHGDLAMVIVTILGSVAGVITYVVAVPILLLRRRARGGIPRQCSGPAPRV